MYDFQGRIFQPFLKPPHLDQRRGRELQRTTHACYETRTSLQAQAGEAAYAHPLSNALGRMTVFGPNMMFADSCARAGIQGTLSICPPDCFHYKGTLDVLYKIVRQAKAGAGSATLSMVTESLIFVTKVKLGRGRAEEIYPLGPLNEYERLASLEFLIMQKEHIASYQDIALSLRVKQIEIQLGPIMALSKTGVLKWVLKLIALVPDTSANPQQLACASFDTHSSQESVPVQLTIATTLHTQEPSSASKKVGKDTHSSQQIVPTQLTIVASSHVPEPSYTSNNVGKVKHNLDFFDAETSSDVVDFNA